MTNSNDEEVFEGFIPTQEEVEYATKVLVLLLQRVNPKIDAGQAYEILYPFMDNDEGLTEENVISIGDFIRKTAYGNSPQTKQ